MRKITIGFHISSKNIDSVGMIEESNSVPISNLIDASIALVVKG